MDLDTADCILLTEEAYKDARRGSSDAREAITLFAEADCVMNVDIQHHNHKTMENVSATVEELALGLYNALKKIQELEKTLETLKK